jgi:hypothetical protein
MRQDRTFAFDYLQRTNYSRSYATPNPFLRVFTTELYAYTGSGYHDAPYYMKDDTGTCIPGVIENLH